MFQPIYGGNFNTVYSGVSGTLNGSPNGEDKWNLTPKEQKIQELLKMVNEKQAMEEIKVFYRKLGETLLSEKETLQEPDFHNMAFFLKIREQIFSLKQKYQDLCFTNKSLYEEIDKMKKLKENLMKDTEEYNRTVFICQLEEEDLTKYHNQKDENKDEGETKQKGEAIQQANYINETVDKQIANICKIIEKREKTAQENENVMCQILEMAKRLKNIISVSADETNFSSEKTVDDDVLATKAVCVICATRSVEFCLSNCGHCFCGKCVDNIKNYCHVCRKPKSHKIKIYYD